MTQEEKDKEYNALDFEGIQDKSSQILIEIVSQPDIKAAAIDIYHKVKETFTYNELVYMTCCHVGVQLEAALKNPQFKHMVVMMREAQKRIKEIEDEENKGK